MNKEQITEQVLDLVVDITGEEDVREERDLDLFEEDILDSIAAIELLVGIKESFGITIAPTEYERDEMNTVNKIVARVCERLQN